MKIYEIRDPVYGFISFNEWEREIINHPAFQRSRRIRQLAFTDLIYPGATHTRFEHSIGVMHLATKMFDAIVQKDKNKRILKDYIGYNEAGFAKDRQLVRLGGLLHDVGHAPFSHASEEILPLNAEKEKPYKHEDYTVAIIRGPLKEVIEDHKFNRTNYNISAEEVAALIEGNVSILGPRSFWKILISSQLDADRSDYLLRDSLHIGVKYGLYDIDRLLVTLTLGVQPKEESEEVVLGISEGGWHVAESLIIARYQMFTQVYYHKTRRAYDYMLKEALKETIKCYPQPTEIGEFLKYDDYSMWNLMKEKNSEWFQRILKRDHIRMIAETKEKPLREEIGYIEQIKGRLEEKAIWFWEDTPEEVKSWYKIKEGEEIEIIEDNGKVSPLSIYSTIVNSLQRQFAKSRIYVKHEEKKKAKKIINMNRG